MSTSAIALPLHPVVEPDGGAPAPVPAAPPPAPRNVDEPRRDVWSLARAGQTVVVMGTPPLPPSSSPERPWVVVRVEAGDDGSPQGVLERARRRMEQLVGDHEHDVEEALDQRDTHAGLALVRAANRLADRHPQRSALVIDALDQADHGTIEALLELVSQPRKLRLPLIFSVREVPSNHEPLAELLCCAVLGCLEHRSSGPASAASWDELAPSVYRAVRAAAVVGATFHLDDVAHLLDIDREEVLTRFQRATAHGASIVDCGGGWFTLPESERWALVRHVSPAWLERWRQRLWQRYTERQAAGLRQRRDHQAHASPDGEDERVPPGGPSPQMMELPAVAEAEAANGPAHLTVPSPRVLEQYIAATVEAMERAELHRVLLVADQASRLLDRLPPSRERELMQARVLVSIAQAKRRRFARQGSTMTYLHALNILEHAKTLRPRGTPNARGRRSRSVGS